MCFKDQKMYIVLNIQAIKSILRSALQEDGLRCPAPQKILLFILLKMRSQNRCKE